MSTQTSVWVMINTDGVSDKISDLVDSGYFNEAQSLDYQLKSVVEKLNSLVGEKGGAIKLSTYDRQVLELPVTVAEELPLILSGYKSVFGSLMAVGMGLDLREAALAAKKSLFSNEIELYDPEDKSIKNLKKTLQIEDDLFQPQPNLYDESNPKSPAPDADQTSVGKYIPGLSAQQAVEAENSLIQASVQQLMGPAQQVQQQAQQQIQQMQQQQAQQDGEGGPESLLEALSGEKKKESPATSAKQKKEDSDEGSDESESDESSDESESDGSPDESTQKIGKLLSDVEEKIPKLMELHEKNPEAFKKVVNLLHKLVGAVKSRKSDDTKKSEIASMTEELNKMIKLRYPAGTVKNRKRKVIIDGKAVWRSVAAGQVKDTSGNAISVQSHNSKADEGGQEGARG